MRHSPTPSTAPRCTPKPTMRRVNWSITTSTQCARRSADSHRKQIDAPQTVLRVPEDREPRRSRRVWLRPVPDGENASHHILVHGNPERQGDLLRDPWTTPAAGSTAGISGRGGGRQEVRLRRQEHSIKSERV